MSKVIRGVIDLPFINFSDLETIQETILFLQENELFSNEWTITKKEDHVFIKHKTKDWTWIKIFSDGSITYDNHYGITEGVKNELLRLIEKYYPMVKKSLDIVKKVNKPYKMHFNKEERKILIEIDA